MARGSGTFISHRVSFQELAHTTYISSIAAPTRVQVETRSCDGHCCENRCALLGPTLTTPGQINQEIHPSLIFTDSACRTFYPPLYKSANINRINTTSCRHSISVVLLQYGRIKHNKLVLNSCIHGVTAHMKGLFI